MRNTSSRYIVAGAAIGIALLALVAVFAFMQFSGETQRKNQRDLGAVALVKRDQIVTYFNERMKDATLIASRPGVLRRLQLGNMPHTPGDLSLSIDEVIRQTARVYGYADIRVFDARLDPVAALTEDPPTPEEIAGYRRALETRQAVIHDPHFSPAGRVHFGLTVPVFRNADPTQQVIGLVCIQIDASEGLYPMITRWPDESASAETLLIRHDRDTIQYLSPLRRAPHQAPLSLRRPLAEVGYIGLAKTSDKGPAFVEGNDFSRVAVVGASIPVGLNDWHVVAKRDHAEIDRPIRLFGAWIAGAVLLGLLLLILSARLQFVAARATREARDAQMDAKYTGARKASFDAYLVYDDKARLIDVNPRMEEFTGYSREELLRMSIGDFNSALTREQIAGEIEKIRRQGGDRLRTRWRRKDGSHVEVEISAAYVPDPAGDTFHSFAHDIGPELEATRRIERLNNFHQFLSHANATIFRLRDPEDILNAVCEGAVRDGGFILAWAGVLDEAAGRVKPTAAFGGAADYARQIVITIDPALPTSHGPTRQSMVQKSILYIDDFQNDPRTAPWHGHGREYGIRSCAAVPIVVNDKSIAALSFYSSQKGHFDSEIRALLEDTARNVSLAWQAANAEKQRLVAESERHAIDQLFHRAFDASPLPMQITSLATRRWKFINQAHIRTFGYTREQLATEADWFERAYPDPDTRAKLHERWDKIDLPRAVADGPGSVIASPEIAIRCADGSDRIARGFLSVVADDVIVQWEDLTDIKRAEAELIENERRFRGLIEQSLTGIYVTQDDRIVYANPRLAEITGWTERELLGRESLEVFAADEDTRRTILEARARLHAGTARSVPLVIPYRTKDGRPIDLGIHAGLGVWNGRSAVIVLAQDITERQRAEARIAAYVKELEATMETTLQAVATMVDMRDPYTAGHERRVGLISSDIAREMGWTEERCHQIQLIGLVHDIGKISVPAELLSKPTRLSAIEYELIKAHAERGYEILKDVKASLPIAEIVREHHERMDGSGYPQGLRGPDILPEARILAVADVLESMASHRPYRPALGVDAAIAELEAHRETWYDADVVDAVLRLVRMKGYTLPD